MSKEQFLAELGDLFYLSTDEKETLFWKTADSRYFKDEFAMQQHNNARANRPAGTKAKDGYIRVQWKGVKYSAHHIAYALKNGRWPNSNDGLQIDHENRDRSDNSKILETTRQENLDNRGGQFERILFDRKRTTADIFAKGKAILGQNDDRENEAAPMGFILKEGAKQELIKISSIKMIGPKMEKLTIREKVPDIDKELIRQETRGEDFTFFEPLQVVRVFGQDTVYLADGFIRLSAYVQSGSFDLIPVDVWEVKSEDAVEQKCREVSADMNTRPKANLDREYMRQKLYEEIWRRSKIDANTKEVTWIGSMIALGEKFRCGKNSTSIMRKMVKHIVQYDIEPETYMSDLILFNKKMSKRDESISKKIDERDEMEADLMAEIDKILKRNSYAEVISDPARLARVIAKMAGNSENLKEAIGVSFNLNAPITPKRIEPPHKQYQMVTQNTLDILEF